MFNYLTSAKPENGGIALRFAFPNGYGASVIRHDYSYGHEEGLWELAVLLNDEIAYNTSITNDILGSLTEGEVQEILEKIKKLD